jgi:hypothetical protein
MTDVCLADRRCRNYNFQHQRAAEVAETALCPDCLFAGEQAAAQLVLDYRDLARYLPKFPTQAMDGQPGGSGEAPIPIRVNIEALQRAIWWVTTAWAEVLADLEHLSHLSKRVRDGWAVNWACGILEPRVHKLALLGPQQLADYPLCADEDAVRHRSVVLAEITGAQGILDLMWLHDRARSWLGLTKRVKHLPGRCQQKHCARDELQQVEGSDTVYCNRCGHTMPYDDYERYGNAFLQGAA